MFTCQLLRLLDTVNDVSTGVLAEVRRVFATREDASKLEDRVSALVSDVLPVKGWSHM